MFLLFLLKKNHWKVEWKWKDFVAPVSVHLALRSQMSCKLYSRVRLFWLVSWLLRYCKSYPALQTAPTGHFRGLILPPFVLRTQLIRRPPRLALLQTVQRGGVDAAGRSAAWNKPPCSSALFLSAGDTWLHTRELAVYEASKSVPISCGTCSSLRAFVHSLTQDEICFHTSGKLAQYQVLKRQFIWLTWMLGMFLPSPLVRLLVD